MIPEEPKTRSGRHSLLVENELCVGKKLTIPTYAFTPFSAHIHLKSSQDFFCHYKRQKSDHEIQGNKLPIAIKSYLNPSATRLVGRYIPLMARMRSPVQSRSAAPQNVDHMIDVLFCGCLCLGVHFSHMFATMLFREGYRRILKPILFRCDPERVHDAFVFIGKTLGGFSPTTTITRFMFAYQHPSLEQTLHGIHFKNPIGLSAGFDKNAELTSIMNAVGFGFTEVGSITGEPCAGNPKPRLWRLPKSRSIMVWYGLKNDGAVAIAERLRYQSFPIPVGTSVARTNDASTVEIHAGIQDYAKAFSAFTTIGAYTTVNISCPNTCGGEPFTTPERLDRLLTALDGIATEKPVVLKFPVDLTFDAVDALIDVALRHRVHGLVLSNLTKDHHATTVDHTELTGEMKGGLSGMPTQERSTALIAHVYNIAGHRLTLIGSGGVFTAEDAYAKIRAGASLVQLATGMIFCGPQVIGEINRGIAALLARDGFSRISEAVGADHRPKQV
jgi:dihydroorotate dehydrogenase